MALWLELIPKIHRSDDLGRRFHLLDNHDNETTFEEDGTRQILLDDVLAGEFDGNMIRTTASTTSTTTSTTTTVASATSVMSTTVITTKRPTVPQTTTASKRQPSTNRPKSAASSSVGSVIDKVSGNVPLSVTVAVGCTLLLLNIIVFVGMYCQKRKVRLKLSMASSSTAGGVMMTSHDDVKSFGDVNDHRRSCESDNNSNGSSLSSFSLAASTTQVMHQLPMSMAGQQIIVDGGKHASSNVILSAGRNVRFCESSMTTPAGHQHTPPEGAPVRVVRMSTDCRRSGISAGSDGGTRVFSGWSEDVETSAAIEPDNRQ
jgi:hypothetical protein